MAILFPDTRIINKMGKLCLLPLSVKISKCDFQAMWQKIKNYEH